MRRKHRHPEIHGSSADADLVLVVVDKNQALSEEDRELLRQVRGARRSCGKQVGPAGQARRLARAGQFGSPVRQRQAGILRQSGSIFHVGADRRRHRSAALGDFEPHRGRLREPGGIGLSDQRPPSETSQQRAGALDAATAPSASKCRTRCCCSIFTRLAAA